MVQLWKNTFLYYGRFFLERTQIFVFYDRDRNFATHEGAGIWWIFFNHIVMRENEKVVGDRPKPSNFHPKHCRNWNNMYPPSSSPERSENTNDAIESWVLEEGLVNINWYTCCRPILNWEYARIRIHHQTLSTNIHQLGLTNKLTIFTQTHHYPNNSSPKIFGTSYWSSKARVEGYSPKQWSNK